MEAKFLASLFSFLSIFLAIYADALALNVNDDDDDSAKYELETAIYYGDSSVNLGEPFSITCIIPVTDPIFWTKDGEPITRHNLRHGRDEHSYIPSESPIEGERHKIEAHINVRHALKVHEGKYQCNNLHSSYHILHVRSPVTSDANELSTLAGYESIYDLTPNSVDELFLRGNAVIPPPLLPQSRPQSEIGPLPFPTQATSQHNRQGHHHHHTNLIERRLNFMNNTDNHYGESKSDSSYELVGSLMHNSEYMPPTSKNELTTVKWLMTPITRHGPPPVFPTPRTTWLTPTLSTASIAAISPASPPLPHIPHVMQHQTPTYMHAENNNNNKHIQQQHHSHHHAGTVAAGSFDVVGGTFEQPRFPLQTMQTTHQHQYTQQQQQQHATQNVLHTFPPITTAPLSPVHPNSQTKQHHVQRTHQIHHQHKQQQQLQQYNVPSPGTVSSSSASNSYTTKTTTATALYIAQSSSPTIVVTDINTTNILQPNVTSTQMAKGNGLKANYNDIAKKMKSFVIRSPLLLSCKDETNSGNTGELTWLKNNTDVKNIKSLEGRYRIIAAENTFVIDKTVASDDGVYSCTKGDLRADFNVYAQVVVSVPSNVGVVEGEKLSITCTVVGTNPELRWVFGADNKTINSTDRFALKANENMVENAILTIENVSLDDRGEYKCIGKNAANEYSDMSYVRVKGKLAALWPFLGICAEVLILCAIILIYEKRRNKTELEESDTDPQDHGREDAYYDD